MQTPLVVPPLDGIVPVNFQLKPVLQTATQTQCNQIGIKSQPLRERRFVALLSRSERRHFFTAHRLSLKQVRMSSSATPSGKLRHME